MAETMITAWLEMFTLLNETEVLRIFRLTRSPPA